MATPETSPRKPSAAATLAAAGQGTAAAGRVAATPTVVAAQVQARAVAEATQRVVSALATFAHGRRTTIIPLLQQQLVEHFSTRTPDEISKLLVRENAREREFLRRQEARIKRDMPKVLAEADLEKRRAAMDKLMAREQRYMGQRERAMTARAHSAVASLDLEEASPEGAYWLLGGPVHQHTPGCVAMAGKFWPWPVLRDVISPPVHPGCPCELISLNEAVKQGFMRADQLPDLKDALLRARRNLELEESIAETFPEWLVADEMAEFALEENDHGVHPLRLRFAKGLVKGGQFLPKLGGYSNRVATKRLIGRKLGARAVWIKGHRVHIPESRSFAQTIGGHSFTSPPGGTNVYRDGELVSTEDRPSMHRDLRRPRGPSQKAALTKKPTPTPTPVLSAEAQRAQTASRRVERALRKAAPDVAPVSEGQGAHEAHRALRSGGFRADESNAKQTSETLTVPYQHRDGHDLEVTFDRASSKVESSTWKPGAAPSDTTGLRKKLGLDKPKPKAEPTPEPEAPVEPVETHPGSPTLGTGDVVWARQLERAKAGEPEAQWDLAQEVSARGPNSDFALRLRDEVGARKLGRWMRDSAWPGGSPPKGAPSPRYTVLRSTRLDHGPSVGAAAQDGIAGGPGDSARPLGTGHYFTSRPTPGSSGEGVALAGAHLHRPVNAESSRALGRALGMLNEIARGGGDTTTWIDPNSGQRRLFSLSDVLDTLPDSVASDDAALYAEHAVALHRDGSDESAATHLMRALGFDGVDNRHLPELDSPAYGSVVYEPLGRQEADPGEQPAATTDVANPKVEASVREASSAIAGVVVMPEPIRITTLGDDDLATARSLPSGEIAVHQDSGEAVLTNAIVHEAGHVIDRSLLGSEDAWFSESADAAPLVKLMRDSPTMQAVKDDRFEVLRGDERTKRLMLMAREMFARAFHQYVAERSGDPTLTHEIQHLQGDNLLRFQVWPDNEFAPIAAELEKALAPHAPTPEPEPLTVKTHEGAAGNSDHITRTETGSIPTSDIASLGGVRGEVPGEHRNRRGPEWDKFLSDIQKNGIRDPIFITVDPGGVPQISEGNHRRDAAVELGLPHVPVEIRYYGKAEDQGTVSERAQNVVASPGQGGAVLRGKVGRWVWIRGRVNFIPQDALWEKKSDNVDFMSPAGGTKVYRRTIGEWVLVSEPRKEAMHPDVRDPKIGGTARGLVRPKKATLTEPNADGTTEPPPVEPESDEIPEPPKMPEGVGRALSDAHRDQMLAGGVTVGQGVGATVGFNAAQREAINSSGLPEGRLTIGPLWYRMTPEERQVALDTAYGHALSNAVHNDDDARDDLGKLWTAEKFQSQVNGETQYLDRYNANTALATAYARMGGEDWRDFASQYPDVAHFAATQASRRGYFVRPDVAEWLTGTDNAHAPTRELPDGVKAEVAALVGGRAFDAEFFLKEEGFAKFSDGYSPTNSVTYRKVDPETQTVQTVVIRVSEADPENPYAGPSVVAAEGTAYGFDPNQEPPEGDTPERLAWSVRGMAPRQMLLVLGSKGYFSLTARNLNGAMHNVWVKPDSDITIWTVVPGDYSGTVTDARPTMITDAEQSARMIAISRSRPDLGIPVGTDFAELKNVIRSTGWAPTFDTPTGKIKYGEVPTGSIELLKSSNSDSPTDATIDIYRVLLNDDGSVKEIGRPGEIPGTLAVDDADWQRRHAKMEADFRTELAARRVRVDALKEHIRTRINAGEAPDVKGSNLGEVTLALMELGYTDQNTSRFLKNGNYSDTWQNRKTGARLTLRSKENPAATGDESIVRSSQRLAVSMRVMSAGRPDEGRQMTPPGEMPPSVAKFEADIYGFADALAKEQNTSTDLVKLSWAPPPEHPAFKVTDPGGMGGWHSTQGEIRLGNTVGRIAATAMRLRAEDTDLSDIQKEGLAEAYKTIAHEVIHSVHAPNQDRTANPEDGELGLEEWLTEDLARQVAVDYLERHGHHDVVAWWEAHRTEAYQSYPLHRTNGYQLLRDMGLGESQASNAEIRKVMEDWKYRSTRIDRRVDMIDRLMENNQGMTIDQADNHIKSVMGLPDKSAGLAKVEGFRPRMKVSFPLPPPDPDPYQVGLWVSAERDGVVEVGQISSTSKAGVGAPRRYRVEFERGGASYRHDELAPAAAPPPPDVPTITLGDGGVVSEGGMIMITETGKPGQVVHMTNTGTVMVESEGTDQWIDPSALSSLAITSNGKHLRVGDEARDPASGFTGRIEAIDWTDSNRPRVRVASTDPEASDSVWVPMRSVEYRVPNEPNWRSDADWVLWIEDRNGNPGYVIEGEVVRLRDGRTARVDALIFPDWPSGTPRYNVTPLRMVVVQTREPGVLASASEDDVPITVPRESIVGYASELPRVEKAPDRLQSAIDTLVARQAVRPEGDDRESVSLAEQLGLWLGNETGRGIEQWANRNNVPLNGSRGFLAVMGVYKNSWASEKNYTKMDAEFPSMLAAVMELAHEAGLPTPPWAGYERMAPGIQSDHPPEVSRLDLKPPFEGSFGSGRRMTTAQVRRRMQDVAKDVAAYYETPVPTTRFEPEAMGSLGSDARAMKPKETYPGSGVWETPEIWYGQEMMDNARDIDKGVMPYRQMAHEAIHASVSGDHFTHGYAHEVEEGGSEVLALWYWKHRGQPFDHRDAVRPEGGGGWTAPGIESLAHSVAYRPYVEDLVKRAASKVGWDRGRIIGEVERVMRGNHGDRIAFLDETVPQNPPSSIENSAPGLMQWLLSDVGGDGTVASDAPSVPAGLDLSPAMREPRVVTNVNDAVQAILAGEYVEIDTPRKVHTALKRLAAMAEDAKEKGEAAPIYDLCRVSVKGTNVFCAGKLRTPENPDGIPRIQMPQFAGVPAPGSEAESFPRSQWNPERVNGSDQFIEFLKSRGIKTTLISKPVASLSASQSELRGPTVAKMMVDTQFDIAKHPIFVSRDGYIVDGHHRWAANVGRDAEDGVIGNHDMPVQEVDAPISVVMALANEWSARVGFGRRTAQAPIPDGSISDPDVARAIFTGTFGSKGFKTVVEGVTEPFVDNQGNTDTRVRGRVETADGQYAGKFTRVIVVHPDATGYVYHDTLVLTPRSQGTGFATDFNNHLFAEYAKRGITEVRLEANADVGGYTWAAAGFDFRIPDAKRDGPDLTDQQRAEFRADRAAVLVAQALDFGYITRAEFDGIKDRFWSSNPATAGRYGFSEGAFDPERHTHHAYDLAHDSSGLGKAILLSQGWVGVKVLA